MGVGCPASAGVEWPTPASVGRAATPIQLLGLYGDPGVGSRIQPVGFLALRRLDPAVIADLKVGPTGLFVGGPSLRNVQLTGTLR
jgi:hypothetical protein